VSPTGLGLRVFAQFFSGWRHLLSFDRVKEFR
jgi:hypothetical protein